MHLHPHFLHFVLNRELSEIYANIALKSFAFSLISIFVPLYLLKLGFGLGTVLIFFAVLFGTLGLLTPFAAYLASKIGLKRVILISVPPMILFYLLLGYLPAYPILLWVLAIIYGFSESLYVVSFQIDFALFSDKRHRSEEVGYQQAIPLILAVIGPVVGALIITAYNFSILFIITVLLLFSSAMPLFLSADVKKPYYFRLSDVFKKSNLKNALVFICGGCKDMGNFVFWPVFIFLILKDYLSLGIVASIAALVTVVFTVLIGMWSDKFGKKKMLKIGSLSDAITWFVRIFTHTLPQIAIISSISSITTSAARVPYHAMLYDKANQAGVVEFIVFKELMLMVSHILLPIALVFLFASNLAIGLVICGIAALGYWLF